MSATESGTRRELLSTAQVCEELDIHPNTLRQWRLRGVAPRCLKLPNGELRYRRDWLEDWLLTREDAA